MKILNVKHITEAVDRVARIGRDYAKNMPLFLQDLPNIRNLKMEEAKDAIRILKSGLKNYYLIEAKKDPKIKITKFAKSRATVIFGSNLYFKSFHTESRTEVIRPNRFNDLRRKYQEVPYLYTEEAFLDYETEYDFPHRRYERHLAEMFRNNSTKVTKLRVYSTEQCFRKEEKDLDEVDLLIAELEFVLGTPVQHQEIDLDPLDYINNRSEIFLSSTIDNKLEELKPVIVVLADTKLSRLSKQSRHLQQTQLKAKKILERNAKLKADKVFITKRRFGVEAAHLVNPKKRTYKIVEALGPLDIKGMVDKVREGLTRKTTISTVNVESLEKGEGVEDST
jgi:hypothetical protein